MKKKIWLAILSVVLVVAVSAAAACAKKEYSVTVAHCENGSVAAVPTVKEGDDLEIAITPDRGYVLDALKINGKTVDVNGSTYTVEKITSDISISATFQPVTMTVIFEECETLPSKQVTFNGTYGELPEPTPPVGFRFKGWFTEENGQGARIESDSVVSVISDHTLYPYFSDKYTVTFDYGDGNGTETVREIAYNTAIGKLPETQAPENSVFVGFYLDSVLVGETYKVTGDITLKAGYVVASIDFAENSALTAVAGLDEESNRYPTFEISVFKDGSPISAEKYTVTTDDVSVAEYTEGKLVAKEDGTVKVIVKFNEVEVARSEEITCRSYADYIKVSDKAGFLNIANDKAGKYCLIRDIDLENAALWDKDNGYAPWFGNFSGIIDGLGHVVSNATAHPSGYNNGAFKVMEGEIRNIAFVGMKTEASKVANNGFFGDVKGLVENVFLDIEFCYTDAQPEAGWAPFASYVNNGGTLRNCVANITTSADELKFVAGIAVNAAGWTGKTENCFTLVNGKRTGADILDGLYWTEAAEGVAEAITVNSGVFQYTYNLINGTEVDVSLLDPAVWSVNGGALYFHDEIALAATPEYILSYTGGNIEKTYEKDLPTKEILSIDLLHNTEKVNEIPQDFLTFSSTNDNVAVAGIDEEGILFIDYKGPGTAEITVALADNKEIFIKFSVTLTKTAFIATKEEFRTKIKADFNGNFVLTADIDFNNETISGKDESGASIWNSLGEFKGTLDGNGHKLSNFIVGNGWDGGLFKKVNGGTIKNVAFINVQGPGGSANTANGLFGSLDGGCIIENIYVDYVMCANGGQIGSDANYVAAGPLTGTTFSCTVNNVIINLRFAENFDFNAIDRIGSIAGKACAWASSLSNVRVIVNAPEAVSLKLAWADGDGETGVQSTWKNCVNYKSLAELAKSDITSFTAWTITENSVSLGDTVVLQIEAG